MGWGGLLGAQPLPWVSMSPDLLRVTSLRALSASAPVEGAGHPASAVTHSPCLTFSQTL